MKCHLTLFRVIKPILLAGCLLALPVPASAVVLQVSWERCPDAESYLVYCGTQSGQYGSPKVISASGATSYRLTDLSPNTSYFVALKAVNKDGESSPLSEEVSGRTMVDSDGDGMSDAWESRYGLNPNDPSDATADADSDKYSNLAEYEAGSAPNNSATVPESRPDPGTSTSGKGGGGGCFIATAAYGSPMASQVNLLKAFRDRWLLTWGPGKAFVATYYDKGPAAAQFIRGQEGLRWLVRGALTPLVGLVSLGGWLLAGAGALGWGARLVRRGSK